VFVWFDATNNFENLPAPFLHPTVLTCRDDRQDPRSPSTSIQRSSVELLTAWILSTSRGSCVVVCGLGRGREQVLVVEAETSLMIFIVSQLHIDLYLCSVPDELVWFDVP
jgi:hypothetical protein